MQFHNSNGSQVHRLTSDIYANGQEKELEKGQDKGQEKGQEKG